MMTGFVICYLFLYSAPGVVEFHVSSLMTAGQVEVSWSPPRQPNGVITSYEVIYSVYESSIITTSGILSNTTNIYSIKNLGMLNEIVITSDLLFLFHFRARSSISSNSGSIYQCWKRSVK